MANVKMVELTHKPASRCFSLKAICLVPWWFTEAKTWLGSCRTHQMVFSTCSCWQMITPGALGKDTQRQCSCPPWSRGELKDEHDPGERCWLRLPYRNCCSTLPGGGGCAEELWDPATGAMGCSGHNFLLRNRRLWQKTRAILCCGLSSCMVSEHQHLWFDSGSASIIPLCFALRSRMRLKNEPRRQIYCWFNMIPDTAHWGGAHMVVVAFGQEKGFFLFPQPFPCTLKSHL